VHVLRSPLSRTGIGLSLVLAVAGVSVAAQRQPDRSSASTPPIYVGSDKIRTAAFVDGAHLFVPVRGVFEAIGADVSYVAPHFVVVRKNGVPIAAFMLDRRHAIIGRRAVELDSSPTRRDGRIFVPLRVVAEAAGATVAYRSRPPVVHISAAAPGDVAANAAPTDDSGSSPAERTMPSPTVSWLTGVALVTGLCSLLCLVLTARRFAPTLFRPRTKRATLPPAAPAALSAVPPPDRVALSSVQATGEARFRKELVTETRTVHVPVTREELVIEYAGEGGTVIIEGRELFPGETVRIPLWEERVSIDVTKHVLQTEDIIAARRRTPLPEAPPLTPDFSVVEGNPS
jgi:uncharacterized protein (TIGR02271 family)